MKAHGRTSFTLIELLVVTSIIVMLISFLLPSLKKGRSQAKQVVCAHNLKQITQGLWNYWTDNNEHVPYAIDPMTNGKPGDPQVRGFGEPISEVPDHEIDPFDRQRWPLSLANTLMPNHVGTEPEIFVCPAAVRGWPREGGPFRFTYRPAAANQPYGLVDVPGGYFREHFGFLDGRIYRPLCPLKRTGNVITDAMKSAEARGTYLRDMVLRVGANRVIGPHRGGNNVINKRLEIEYRDEERTNDDLAPFGQAVPF